METSDVLLNIRYKLEKILKKNFSNTYRQKIDTYPDRWNFCCPICGDSVNDNRKKRGNLYLNSMSYHCYNCGCHYGINSFLHLFNEELSNDDKVVSMSLCEEGTDVLVVSENGFGKRTDINEYRTQIRAGKGIKTYNIAEKTGKLVGAEMVNEDDEMMIINSDGVLIRLRVNEISLFGRVTSGVKLMKTDDEVNVVSISKIKMEEE